MALCFISNKDLTIPYSDLARSLSRKGERIVWLAPSTRWTKWLLAEGWPAEDILNLAAFADEWRDLSIEQSAASLADVEGEAPETIGNVIRMCRNLRRLPSRLAYAYLAVARRHIEPFLRDRGVEVVFGEGTWGFEQMAALIGRRHGIPVLTPAPTRIPVGRFYFGHSLSSRVFSFAEATAADHEWAEQFLDSWLTRPTQPGYMLQHKSGYQPFHARWLGELAIGLFRPELDRNDFTLWPLQDRITDRSRRFLNSMASAYLRPYEQGPADERYVLYPLHHQPEASIDVYGSLNSDQVGLIDTLSRLLPATHKLWVKEHKSGLGDRSLAWYRRVRAMPNVRLIDPYRDIYQLIRGADLLVTISGTAAYEAALMGVPTFGLSAVFFSPILSNTPTQRTHPLEWHMRSVLSPERTESAAEMRRKAIGFLAYLHANSFPGDPSNPADAIAKRAQGDYNALEVEGFVSFVAAVRKQREAVPGAAYSSMILSS
jgi:hypothetical protein